MGDQAIVEPARKYIQTPSIKAHLNNLARIIISKKYPILLQVRSNRSVIVEKSFIASKNFKHFGRTAEFRRHSPLPLPLAPLARNLIDGPEIFAKFPHIGSHFSW